MVELDGKVRARIEHDFAPKDWDSIADLLRAIPDAGPRVHMAVLTLAEGDANKLFHYLDAAAKDWRDVIYWAENPRQADEMTEEDARALAEGRYRPPN